MLPETKMARAEIENLTELLCISCTALEQNNVDFPEQIKTWWKKNKAMYAGRLKSRQKSNERSIEDQEKIDTATAKMARIKLAMAGGKLSTAERKILGL